MSQFPGIEPPSLFHVMFMFSGRISRSQFWVMGLIPAGILTWVLRFILLAVDQPVDTVVGMVALAWVYAAIWIKRCHDLDMSAWLALVMVVPLANIVMFCILGFQAGKPKRGPNRYGHSQT